MIMKIIMKLKLKINYAIFMNNRLTVVKPLLFNDPLLSKGFCA